MQNKRETLTTRRIAQSNMHDIPPSETPLERDVFNKHFDHFLATGKMNPDIIMEMNAYQRYAVNEVKKAFKRLEDKQ